MTGMVRSAVAPFLICLASVSCGHDYPTGPQLMVLEVSKHEVQGFHVSFTARVINWDGEAEIHYEAFSCPVDAMICVDTPFHEASVTAEVVTQPYAWTQDLCDVRLIFRASLPSGDFEEASHITCS